MLIEFIVVIWISLAENFTFEREVRSGLEIMCNSEVLLRTKETAVCAVLCYAIQTLWMVT